MGALSFFRESLRNLKTVGTITRSGNALCKGIIKPINFKEAKTIVELGAGDGVITRHILRRMQPDARLMVFEVNPAFCKQLRALQDPRLIVVEDSAEKLRDHLKVHAFGEVDAVVSAIPFVSLPKPLASSIVNTCLQVMKCGGTYCQVHYSLIMKKFYESIFGNIEVDFVPMNMPPAFVLSARKQAA